MPFVRAPLTLLACAALLAACGGSSVPCVADDDCAPRERCAASAPDEPGTCTAAPECDTDATCPPLTVCVVGGCRAVPATALPCEEPEDCDADRGETCRDGACRAASGSARPCTGDIDCPRGEGCSSGACRIDPTQRGACEFDADCGIDEYCGAVGCAPIAGSGRDCGGHDDCPPGESCANAVCVRHPEGRPCEATSDCGPGQACVFGVCTTQGGASCADDTACGNDRACVGGRCINPSLSMPCEFDEECGPGASCFDGACDVPLGSRPCRGDGDCPEGAGCTDGLCAAPSAGLPCVEDADCATGLQCVNGACTAPGGTPCSAPSDCTSGLACRDGRCAGAAPIACFTPGDCGDPEAGCEVRDVGGEIGIGPAGGGEPGGVCTSRRPCLDDLDCGFRSYCSQGECAPSGSSGRSCGTDVECAPGETCTSGVCRTAVAAGQHCLEDSDCARGTCAANGVCTGGAGPVPACGNGSGGRSCVEPTTCVAGACIAPEPTEDNPRRLCRHLSRSCAADLLGCWGPGRITGCGGSFADGAPYMYYIEYRGGARFTWTNLANGMEAKFDNRGGNCGTLTQFDTLGTYRSLRFHAVGPSGQWVDVFLWPGQAGVIRCEGGSEPLDEDDPPPDYEIYGDLARCPQFSILAPWLRSAGRLPNCGLPSHTCGVDGVAECVPGLVCCAAGDDTPENTSKACNFQQACEP